MNCMPVWLAKVADQPKLQASLRLRIACESVRRLQFALDATPCFYIPLHSMYIIKEDIIKVTVLFNLNTKTRSQFRIKVVDPRKLDLRQK